MRPTSRVEVPARLEVLPILKGVIAAFAFSAFVAILLALAVKVAGMGETAALWSIRIGSLLAVAFGGALSAKKAHGKGLMHGALAGLLYSGFCALLLFLLPGPEALPVLKTLAIGTIVGSIGGIIGVNL